MPGGNTTVILQASNIKVHLDEATGTRPYLRGKVSLIEEQMEPTDSDEFKALMDTCIELSNNYIEASEQISPDITFALKNLPKNHILVDYICTNFPLSIEDKFHLLNQNTLKDRLYNLIQVLNRETKLANLKQDIQMRTREELDKQQREYFLQQQIKNIQDELGHGQDDEIEELRKKGKGKSGKRSSRSFRTRSFETGAHQSTVARLQRTAQLPANVIGIAMGGLYYRRPEHTQRGKSSE